MIKKPRNKFFTGQLFTDADQSCCVASAHNFPPNNTPRLFSKCLALGGFFLLF
jgi:hypothetical protein